jgi:[NiFe] hydrogenase diaphorase moiety small subunit
MTHLPIPLTVDGRRIEARPGQTILEATDAAGVYIPRLCWMKGLLPFGSCRVCTVRVNGRTQAACTQPVAPGMVVENDTAELRELRRDLIEMLFVEGNHFCMVCAKSGNCELQALAYRLVSAPTRSLSRARARRFAPRDVLDRDRCVLAAACALPRTDGKAVFGFEGRGPGKCIAVNAVEGLAASAADAADHAAAACPTGALMAKRVAFAVPVGQRLFDRAPIGSQAEPPATEK